MGDRRYTREDCLGVLREKYAELTERGEGRYPQRSDLSQDEVVAIKAFFGPWPRALEAAGIKPPRDDDRAQRNKEKRIAAKRRRIEVIKKQKRAGKHESIENY